MQSNSSKTHSKNRNNRARKALSVVVAFLMGLAIFCGVLAMEMRFGWLSCKGLYQTMVGGGYAYKNVQQLEEDLGTLLAETSLSGERLEECYSEEDLYRTYIKNVEAVLLKGKSSELDTDSFGTQLVDAITADLQSQNVTLTDDMQRQIEQVGVRATQIYTNTMSASFVEKFREISDAFGNAALVIMVVSLAVVVAGVLILMKLYRYKHHSLQYIAAAILFALLCNIATVVMIGRDGWIRESGIGPEAYRAMLEQFNLRGLEFGGLITLAELVILLGLCILIQRLKKQS